MNKQHDFASLSLPALESDAFALSDDPGHEALSRPSSLAMSVDSLEQSNDGAWNSPRKVQDVTEELRLFFSQSKLTSQCPSDRDRQFTVHQTQPMVAGGRCQQPVGIGGELPPPRRFYRRFWLGISRRLMKAESGDCNK